MKKETEVIRMKVIRSGQEQQKEARIGNPKGRQLHRQLAKTRFFSILALIVGVSSVLYQANQYRSSKQLAESERQTVAALQQEISLLNSELKAFQSQTAWLAVSGIMRSSAEMQNFRISEIKPYLEGDPLAMSISIKTLDTYEMLEPKLAKNIHELIFTTRHGYEIKNELRILPAWDEMEITFQFEYAPGKIYIFRSPKKLGV